MKNYHGTRISEELGDVQVEVQQLWGFCTECKTYIPAGPDNQYEHFNEQFDMCSAEMSRVKVISTPLKKRNDIEPTDFEWGKHRGVGAQNLAIAILWDALNEPPSRYLIRNFANELLSRLPEKEWNLSEDKVIQWFHSKSHRHILV